MTRARIDGIAPFFIVTNVRQTVDFYAGKLGFETEFLDPPDDPFFAMIRRDGAAMFFKSQGDVVPQPNTSRHAWIKWDAYFFVPDPDGLAAEFAERGVAFQMPLGITSENLRGFTVRDPDGYVLFFGRPN